MKLSKICAVTLVTAFLFISFIVPSSAASTPTYWDYYDSGYLPPSPDFPNRESLPYGNDTCVYDFPFYYGSSNGGIFRVYVKRDLYSGSGVSAFNGVSVVMVDNNSGTYPAFEILVTSSTIIYTQTYYYDGSGNFLSWTNLSQAPYVKQKDGKTYNFGVKVGNISGSTRVQNYFSGGINATDPCYYGGRDLKALLDGGIFSNAPADERPAYSSRYYLRSEVRSYPTSNDLSSKDIANAIDESNTKVINQIKAESEKQITAINNAASKIEGAITEAVDEIINAGSDLPTLDTDNEWMNDSLTKVNYWLSQLEDFEEQMKDAESDNAENMNQAKNFINGFFGVVPAPLIASLVLVLVVLVAVKIVGR